MKRDIRLIALDLDGTALNSAKQLTPAVHDAIAQALDMGVVVLAATGRNLTSIPQEFLSIPKMRYALCCNGAHIYDISSGSTIHSDCFDAPTALSLLADCQRLNALPAVMIGRDVYAEWMDFDLLREQFGAGTVEYLKSTRTQVNSLAELIKNSKEPVAKISLVFLTMQARAQTVAHFSQRSDCTVTASFSTNLELNTATANKGAGVLALAQKLGLEKSQLMAAGDGLNDLDMLRAVGYPVAMGNAIEELFEAAAYITGSCDEDGVATAIRKALGI